jgi:sec-independent protein translocase protein TatA
MFGIGMPELIIIFVIALIVIGPHKLPDLARSLGKGLAEFKKASEDFQRSIHEETRKEEVRKAEEKMATEQPPVVAEKVPQETASAAPQAAPAEKKESSHS